MELLQTDKYYIFNRGQDSLWCNRKTGQFEGKTCWDLASAENPTCLGIIHLLLGKLQIHPDLPPRLLLVSGVREVGLLGGGGQVVYCITRVIFLPLAATPPDSDLNLQPCHKHVNHPTGSAGDKKLGLPFSDLHQKVALSKTFGTLRSVTSTIKTATVNAAATAAGQGNKVRREARDRERYERRVLDELSKMFNDSDSFYYSSEADLTSSLQRQSSEGYDKKLPLWHRADDNYFWNRYMLDDLINQKESMLDIWIVPVIQGFVQTESVPLGPSPVPPASPDQPPSSQQQQEGHDSYSLTVISRRSRHRAGTRYKRRGVDEEGWVANYVETEQVVSYSHHRVAFVQVRGSVPVFWSQPGYKYRPPPRLDKDETETAAAFECHLEREVKRHGHVNCVSLVEQSGKERVIADAFMNNILHLDSPNLTFITFDFHEYCRGMRYENVSVLVEGLEEVIGQMLYCWVDREGTIRHQKGVFRINCIDCLDRTNVVQTAIAKYVLESQFVKLGMIPPEHPLPTACRSVLQVMWANNGDTISKQYAGTSALKGDFTRTGERRFAGMMKDGMNSANRYYMNRFKDAYRQATIDHLLGNPVTEDLMNLEAGGGGGEEEESSMTPEHVKHVIDDCKKLLVPDAETILGAWGLIEAADLSSGDPDQTDMDIILVLTRDSYYVAQYDEEADQILHYERVSLIDLQKIEMGSYTCQGMFKQPRLQQCIRFNYLVEGQGGYLHTFRSMNIRFFNNMAITIKSEEETVESVKAIGETFEVACQMIGCVVQLVSGKMEKKRSRGRRSQLASLLNPLASLTRTSPDTLRTAGTRAFSNVTSGLAKLNPMSSLRGKRSELVSPSHEASKFYLQKPAVCVQDGTSEVLVGLGGQETYLASCGLLASSLLSPGCPHRYPSPPMARCHSDSSILRSLALHDPVHRSPTPEIVVSGAGKRETGHHGLGIASTFGGLSPTLFMQRVRKISHSSDEVDVREEREEGGVVRASSATDLQLHLPSSHSEGHIGGTALPSMGGDLSSLVSPLSALNKEAMMAPFSVLARGVQSLAPGAGRLARGMQSIGVNLDPRRLRAQRQKQLDDDPVMKEWKANCQTKIIQF